MRASFLLPALPQRDQMPAVLTGAPITGRSYEVSRTPLWMAKLPESGNASCGKRWKPPCSSADPSPSLHHLAKTTSGRHLQDQLDHLKYFENLTGVSHLLVGTYDLRPFRKINAQLACRSVDIHFPRYDAAKQEEAQAFRSVLWALQRQLPMAQEPQLVDQWEFLYARSIGCIGLVKMHLNRALNLALTEKKKTVTLAHLRKTALPEARVELALRNALESETELAESAGSDERLFN